MKKTTFSHIAITALLLSVAGCKTSRNHRCCSSSCDTLKNQIYCDGVQRSGDNNAIIESRIEEISYINVHNTWGAYHPPHLACQTWFLNLNFIYWQGEMDNLEYVAKINNDPTFTNSHQKIKSPHFKWDPGFRLGLGYQFNNHDSWDLFADWTYYHTSAESSTSVEHPVPTTVAPVANTLIPLWGGDFFAELGLFVDNASSEWRLNMNVVDIELGKNYFISKAIAFRPFISVRGASLVQHYNVNYAIDFPLLASFPPSIDLHMEARQKFYGVGPRLGANFIWHFTNHFGITGNINGSLLYGHFHINQEFNNFLAIVTRPEVLFNTNTIHNSYNRVRANLEESLGIEWESRFSCDRYNIAISLSYELAQWFDQNELQNVFTLGDVVIPGSPIIFADSVSNTGDLSLSGATLQIRFDF